MASKKNPRLDALRQQAIERTQAATNKVNRLRRNNGADIAGTAYDPRRGVEKIHRYTENQLQSYLNQVGRFIDRKTQYYGLANGEIITGQEWRKYKGPETKYARRANARVTEVVDKKLPSGTTVGEHLKMMTPDRRSARGVGVNRPYDPPKRRPQDIADRNALKKLTKDMLRRIETDYERKQVARGQREFRKMANVIKDEKLSNMVKNITPDQFRILWNYTNFAQLVSEDYEVMKKMMKAQDQAYESDTYQEQLDEANELVGWASKLNLRK